MNIPPDKIETLRDVLWYLKHYEMTIPLVRNDKMTCLGKLSAEDWAQQVCTWIDNYQLPAREILEDEAKRMIKEIEDAKTTSFAVDSGDDHRCCGGRCRDDDHK